MSAQLSIGAFDDGFDDGLAEPRPKKPSKLAKICKCAHEDRDHANGKGACAFRAGERGACSCKKFKTRARKVVAQPAHLLPPSHAITLTREDLKRDVDKYMGWALVFDQRVTIYLAQLETRSPNKGFFGMNATGAMVRRWHAMQAAYKEACRERTISAIAQCGADVAARGRPSTIQLTRLSQGSLDRTENLRGSMKYVVDGIAEALCFNDAELADSASRASDIPIAYSQEKPGKPKVCGVRIELSWSAT